MQTIHDAYVVLVRLVQVVDLLWVVVGLQTAGCQQRSQLAWMLAGYQLKQASREADIGWSPEYHPIQLSMPTRYMQHTISFNQANCVSDCQSVYLTTNIHITFASRIFSDISNL